MGPAPKDQAFGIWFVSKNVSETVTSAVRGVKSHDWSEALTKAGFGLHGVVPPSFNGIGVLFTMPGSVTIIASDGSKPGSAFNVLNLRENTVSNFDFRKPGIKLTLSFNRNKGYVSMYMVDGDKNKASLELKTAFIPKSGFLGFNGYSGSEGKPDRVLVRQLKTINLDLKKGTGEDVKSSGLADMDERLGKKNIHVDDLLFDDDWIDDPIHQVSDVNKAITILEEYLAETRYRDSSLVRTLSDIQARADSLDDSIKDLRMEIKYSFKDDGGGAGKARMMEEMKGLNDLIQLHSEENESIENLKANMRTINDRVEQYGEDPRMYDRLIAVNAELEAEVSHANFTANAMIGLFGLSVLIVGFVLWTKMRQYEKKHFL